MKGVTDVGFIGKVPNLSQRENILRSLGINLVEGRRIHLPEEIRGGSLGPFKERRTIRERKCLVCETSIPKGEKYLYLPYWAKGAVQEIENREKGTKEWLFRPYTLPFCRKECLKIFSEHIETYISLVRQTEHFQKYQAVSLL